MAFYSVRTGKGTSKELIVFPYGVEEGVLVKGRTGGVTNRWADGTVGVPSDVRELASEEGTAYMPYSMEEYRWRHKNPTRARSKIYQGPYGGKYQIRKGRKVYL